jgi:beta-glucanase (GH16 family)
MKFQLAKRILLNMCLAGMAGGLTTAARPARRAAQAASAASGTPAPAPLPHSAKEKLVWAEEFTSAGRPNPANWREETGYGHWGNHELETYCAYGSNASPCAARKPNLYVGRDGYLHILARRTASGKFTSARIKTEGLKSFQYGRMEARIRVPAGAGLWPAFWMLGDSIQQVGWPACGELDIMENIGKEPTAIHGSIHGPGFTGTALGERYLAPGGVPWSQGFHNYGLIWSPGKVQYYVDSPSNVYATFLRSSLPAGAVWPFDQGKFFFILNLAVGGDWPGPPDRSTQFPAQMLVDYVRVWQRPLTGEQPASR